MAFQSLSKGHLLSSTPLQASDDSGYFGSGQRRNNVNVLNSCSPVKESNFKSLPENIFLMPEVSPLVKLEKNLNFENLTKNESFFSQEITEISELEFTSPNLSSQLELHQPSQSASEGNQKTDTQHESYINFGCSTSASCSSNSLSADHDISYKLFDYVSSNNLKYDTDFKYVQGNLREYQKCESKTILVFQRTKVDFIRELFEKNCHSIISYILSFLSAKELCIVSCVSRDWNKVILSDSKASARKQSFITERFTFLNGPSKENRKGMKYGPAKEHKNVLSELTNIEMNLHTVNAKVSNSKFDSFMRESRNSTLKLLKCPSCFHASKRLKENQYMCTRCSYNFCSSCLNPFFTSHSCFRPQLPNIIVGSKRSKRNLKRL